MIINDVGPGATVLVWAVSTLLLSTALFFVVLKIPKDIGIYLGWLPSLIFLMLSIFYELSFLIFLSIALVIYIVATVLRIDKNKKIKEAEEKKLKEIDKMSISDL